MKKQDLNVVLTGINLSILDSVCAAIVIVDSSSVVHYANQEYLRIANLKYEDIINKRLDKVRHGALMPQVIQTGKPLRGVYRKTGTTECVADISPIYVNNQIVGGISIIRDMTEVQRLNNELQQIRHKSQNLYSSLRQIYTAKYSFTDVIGESKAILEVIALAKQFALRDIDILITGESGTGKEVFAQSIHQASQRSGGPFIAFNCAALNAGIVESELFGYSEGAFTGAKLGGKEGFFTVAEGGTLFLDEVNELSPEAQSKLLRVLQERAVRPVGQTRETPMNVRVIAATNQNLETLVDRGLFRNDLFYRLNVLRLELPPLRKRKEDIMLLANTFARRITGNIVSFSPEVKQYLMEHQWPGNVRELHNTIQYATSMNNSDTIEEKYLPRKITKSSNSYSEQNIEDNALTLKDICTRVEKSEIKRLLEVYGSNLEAKKEIALRLGVSIATLYTKIRKYGIE